MGPVRNWTTAAFLDLECRMSSIDVCQYSCPGLARPEQAVWSWLELFSSVPMEGGCIDYGCIGRDKRMNKRVGQGNVVQRLTTHTISLTVGAVVLRLTASG